MMQSEADRLFNLLNELDANTSTKRHNEYCRAGFSIHGGKSRSINKILQYLPYRKVYCEPCAGAANILLARHPSKMEIINDRHAGITAFYRVVRDAKLLQSFVEKLNLAPHSREEFLEFRDNWNGFQDDVERAFRWYYSFIYSFQSLGRHFGRSVDGACGNMLSRKMEENIPGFDFIHHRIKGSHVLVENLDMIDCAKEFDSEDTVTYWDPPYDTTTNEAVYGCKVNHIQICETIFAMKGFVAISGYTSETYSRYPWDYVVKIPVFSSAAQQTTAKSHSGRVTIEETLFIKE